MYKTTHLKPNHSRLFTHLISKFKEREISTEYAKIFLSNECNIVIAAMNEDEPIGFLLAYKLDRIDRGQTMMFFYEIEVDENFRRQGLASQMIEELKDICRAEKVYKMFVPTNKSNDAAMRLYAKTGGMPSADDDILFEYRF